MAAYQIARTTVLAAVLLGGCRRHGAPAAAPVDAAGVAPHSAVDGGGGQLTIEEPWLHAKQVAGEAARVRAGQTLAFGFTTQVPAVDGGAALRARFSLRDSTGKERFAASDLASTTVGAGTVAARVEAAVAIHLPADLGPCACTAVLTLTDAAFRQGQAELPLTVVAHVAGPPPALTGVLSGLRVQDGDGTEVPFLFPGEQAELVLTRSAPSRWGEKLEITYLGPPPQGSEPTAPLAPTRTAPASELHLPFAVPVSAAPIYAAVIRDVDARGKELGTARLRLPVALPDDERDYLSALRVAKLGIYGGTLGHTALAGILPADRPLAITVSVGGYHVVGRRTGAETQLAIGVTMAVRLRDRGGQIVDAKEEVAAEKGAVVVAPPRLQLAGRYTIPKTFHGRGTLEVEVEDLVKHEVSSVFREIEVP